MLWPRTGGLPAYGVGYVFQNCKENTGGRPCIGTAFPISRIRRAVSVDSTEIPYAYRVIGPMGQHRLKVPNVTYCAVPGSGLPHIFIRRLNVQCWGTR